MLNSRVLVVLFAGLGFLWIGNVTEADLTPGTEPTSTSIESALDSLAYSSRALVAAGFDGDPAGMFAASEVRNRALDHLERGVETSGVFLALSWPRRSEWLRVALYERRTDWTRKLLLSLNGAVPAPGSATRAESGLVLGFSALALLRESPEEQMAFLPWNGADSSIVSVTTRGFQAAAGESSLLRDEALYRLWALAEGEGDTVTALAWADSLVASGSRSLRVPRVRITRARHLLAQGNVSAAIEEARLAKGGADGVAARAVLIEALLAADRPREAALEMESMIGRFGGEPDALLAYHQRLALGNEEASVTLGAETRIGLLTALLKNPESGAVDSLRLIAADRSLAVSTREHASLRLCRALYRARRYTEALPPLIILGASGNFERAEEARLIRARILRNSARIPEMETIYRQVIEANGKEGSTAAWELGREYESLAQWDDAEAAYTLLLDQFPNRGKARDGYFRRGFTRIRQDRPIDAIEDFRRALHHSRPGPDTEQAAYWLARTLQETGDEAGARDAAGAGATRPRPEDYYGVLVRETFRIPSAPVIEPQNAVFKPSRPLETLIDEVSWPVPVLEGYLKGLALVALGERDAARAEWTRIVDLEPKSVSLLQALAIAAAVHNIYPEGVSWANRVRDRLPPDHPFGDGFLRLAYPAAFYGDLVGAARRHDIDPTPLWALMRQESLYQPVVVSRAGAIGLMQIMPTTLDRVVAEWGLDPIPVEALFQPRVNIALGTQFFSERFKEFDDRLLPTLASYNAGERKAWEWLERAGGDAGEVFVECIGYPETYKYTRRIPWLMWVYRSYYAEAGVPPGRQAR